MTSQQQQTERTMNISATSTGVEVDAEFERLNSPSSNSENSGTMLVFEDSNSELSSSVMNEEEDPWIESFPSREEEEEDDEESVDSTLQELTLKDLQRNHDSNEAPPQEEFRRSTRRVGLVFNSHQTYNHIADKNPLGESIMNFNVEESLGEPTTTPFRQARRATAFQAILPVDLTEEAVEPLVNLEAIVQQASDELQQEEEEKEKGPSFREFALLSWSSNKLSLLSDETMFVDDGPRQLDPYCLEEVDFLDVFPEQDSDDCINAKALSKFCFPDGLRVRIIPRVCMPVAMRLKWAGVGADSCHVLVFTDGNGRTQHGVAITVRQEVPLTIKESEELRKILRVRRKRRYAANILCRWWKRMCTTRMLQKALAISNLEDQHSVDELRSELSASELKRLQENLRDVNRNNNSGEHVSCSRKMASSISQWQGKSIKKIIKSPQKIMGSDSKESDASPGASVSSHKSPSHQEVESLTKSVIKRSINSNPTPLDGDCASEVTDDTEPSDTSGGDTITPNSKRKGRLSKLMSSMKTPPTSPNPKASTTVSSSFVPDQSISLPVIPVSREISDWAREKGRESYRAMKHATKHGNAVIMEQCYVLVGCRPDEHALLLGPLQQLVNAERKEINECRASSQGLRIDEYVEKERTLLETQRAHRHLTIEVMLDKLRLSQGQAAITFPRNHLDYIVGGKHYFQTTLPLPKATPIKLPLPLPSIGKQWGLSRLLIDIGPDSLVLVLKLLLMERSILVLGENLQEVTACVCSLLELLEPFEWSSVFLPVLPYTLLDFVTSPVPFVAGMAVRDYDRVCAVEKDRRTLEAMEHGMSLLNLSTNTLHITSEAGISKMLSLDPYLREQLRCIRARLQHLAENPSSTLNAFHRFVRKGFSPKESVALDSACMALENYFSRFCGDLAVDCTAWKQYGTIDVESGKFSFRPEWFMNRIRADQTFHETMVSTQLFHGYVDERRRDQLEVEEMRRGEVGKFIADWIYERWLVWKEQNSPVEV